MHAFLVTVPYVLIEVINFVIANDITDADIYISRSFKNADDVYERLSKADIFKNVYIFDSILLTYPITIKKCIETVKNGWNAVRMIKRNKYSYAYYCNTGWLVNSIFYTGIIKGNKLCEQRFLEHGFGTYIIKYDKKPIILRMLINLMGFRCMDGSMISKLYVYNEKLIKAAQPGVITKMPYIDKNNDKLMKALNYAFDVNESHKEFIGKRIVIMEQGPLKIDFDKEKFWKPILDKIDKRKCIIKAHPRQVGSTLQKSGIDISENNFIPWEVIALNIDVDNLTQISIFSSSCVMPKACCNLEPRVILLYKLLPVDYTLFFGKDIEWIFETVKESYHDKDKFFIPETMEEFDEYCKRYSLLEKN